MKTIGKYTVRRRIGRGGMGAVYLAHDPVIDREVAIKLIWEAVLDHPTARERFFMEAQAAGKLSHDNIVIVHDVGEHDGSPFIVMEHLRGRSLADLISSGVQISPAQALEILQQVCRGLSYSHRNGVIHRDIKPGNIFICETGRVKILDFGIAKTPSSGLTVEGSMLGSPTYMSPEQIRGKPADHRADLFSLGIVMCELFAGRPPFEGEHPTSIMYKIVHEPPDPEPLEAIGDPQVRSVIETCLQKTAEARYADADAMLAALEQLDISPALLEVTSVEAADAPVAPIEQKPGLEPAAATRLHEPGSGETRLAGGSDAPSDSFAPDTPPSRQKRPFLFATSGRWIAVGGLAAIAIAGWLLLGLPSHGTIALDILPWAKIVDVHDRNGQKVPYTETLSSEITPCRLTLAPGDYVVMVMHPVLETPIGIPVTVEAGNTSFVRARVPGMDLDSFTNSLNASLATE